MEERIKFSFSKCMDMCYVVCEVNKSWFDSHSDLSSEEMYELCHKPSERELAQPQATSTWYGLG